MTPTEFTKIVEAISPKRAQVLSKQFKIPVERIKEIADQADPTNGQYTTWLIKQIEGDTPSLVLPEDGPKSKETLSRYVELIKGQADIEPDINKFSSFPALWKAVNAFASFKSQKEIEKALETGGFSKVSEKGEWSLFKITTPQAAAKACRGTAWCVKDPKYAFSYLKQGPLYMFVKGKERTALAHFDSGNIELKDTADAPFTKNGKEYQFYFDMLAEMIDDKVAYRFFELAIRKAIITGNPVPPALEDTKQMLIADERDKYFEIIYGDSKKAYDRISEDWWMGKNEWAVEYSLNKGVELPDQAKYRLMVEQDRAIDYAIKAQKAGIIDFWPELEAQLIKYPYPNRERRTDGWEVEAVEAYKPANRRLKELYAEKHQKKIDEIEAERKAKARAIKQDKEFANVLNSKAKPEVIFDDGSWTVSKLVPWAEGLPIDKILDLVTDKKRQSLVFTTWESLLKLATAGFVTKNHYKGVVTYEDKLTGVAYSRYTLKYKGPGTKKTLISLALFVTSLKIDLLEKDQWWIVPEINPQYNFDQHPAQYIDPLIRIIKKDIEGGDPAFRYSSSGKASTAFFRGFTLFQRALSQTLESIIHTYETGEVDPSMLKYVENNVVPVRRGEDIVKLGIATNGELRLPSTKYPQKISASGGTTKQALSYADVSLSVEQALELFQPVYNEIPPNWESLVYQWFDQTTPPDDKWKFEEQINKFIRKKILQEKNGNPHVILAFMRAYLEHGEPEEMRAAASKVAFIQVASPIIGTLQTYNVPNEELEKDIWRSYWAAMPLQKEQWEIYRYFRLVNEGGKLQDIYDVLTNATRPLPKSLDIFVRKFIDTKENQAWGVYASKFLGEKLPAVPARKFTSKSAYKDPGHTPKFTVESYGMCPTTFDLVLVEDKSVQEVFGEAWIGVDLDGTLAMDSPSGEFDPLVIGDPIESMTDRVREWIEDGQRVKIFTARVADDNPEIKKVIDEWCEQHLGKKLEITNKKDPAMVELWDDRAVQVVTDKGERK